MVRVTLFCVTSQQSIDLVVASVIPVGRGFFQCQDKRVSRTHGTITVAEAEISVKACHTNPIFYKLNDQPQTKVLAKDSEVTLKHKDKFSLLPNEFEYEVRVVEQGGDEPMAVDEPVTAVAGSSADARKRSHGEGQTEVDTKRMKPIVGPADSSSNAAAAVPAPLIAIIKPDPDQVSSEAAGPPVQIQPIQVKPEPLSQPDAASSANSAGTSSPNAAPAIPDVKVKPERAQPAPVPAQPAAVAAPDGTRSSCNHGIRCYNNEAVHRRDQAHPFDADYRRPVFPDPPADTPPCPFGAACYRRNPEHFMRLSHPPSTQYTAQQPAPPPQPPVQRVAFQLPRLNLIYVRSLGNSGDEPLLDEEEGDFDDSLEDEDFEFEDEPESGESGIDEQESDVADHESDDQDSDDPDNCEE